MTLLTEKEARTKWCPHARMVWNDGSTESTNFNRWIGEEFEEKPVTKCIASECMAWRRAPVNPGSLDGEDSETVRHIREGRLIAAIKRRREQTGDGLVAAKDYCVALRARLMPDDPLGYCGLAGEPR